MKSRHTKITEGHQALINTLARPDLDPAQRVMVAKSLAAVEKEVIKLKIVRDRERARRARQKDRERLQKDTNYGI